MPDLRAEARERAYAVDSGVVSRCDRIADAVSGPLIARIAQLEAALRSVEWGCNIDDGHSGCLACPKCGAADYNGHHADCALHAALKEPP